MRFSILALLGLVAYAAFGCLALTRSTEVWQLITHTAVFITLLSAVLAAVYRSGPKRAFWIGFALFGWASLYIYLSVLDVPLRFLTEFGETYLLQVMEDTLPVDMESSMGGYYNATISYFQEIYRSLCSLLFGLIGGSISLLLYSTRQKQDAQAARVASHSPEAKTNPGRLPDGEAGA